MAEMIYCLHMKLNNSKFKYIMEFGEERGSF